MNCKVLIGSIAILGVITAVWVASRYQDAQPLYVWAEVLPDILPDGDQQKPDQLLARAIVDAADRCPSLNVEGKNENESMQERVSATSREFKAIKLCERAYDGSKTAKIGNMTLSARPKNPKNILVIGDTGCRITHYTAQDCKNSTPGEWPFENIAENAAKLKPDLIIHVGDYHYREKPCPDVKKCGDSPYGDNWDAWQADFFKPAKTLLSTAPWIMLRGNHEDCSRAGAGWFFFLEPKVSNGAAVKCENRSNPYALLFRNVLMAVFDTSDAEAEFQRSKRVSAYDKELGAFLNLVDAQPNAPADKWLMLHQPLWSSHGNEFQNKPFETDFLDWANKMLSPPATTWLPGAAILPPGVAKDWEKLASPLNEIRNWFRNLASWPPAPFSLVLSGDTHMFQFFGPQDSANFPVQIVAGMSGDALEKPEDYKTIDGSKDKRPRPGLPANLFGVDGSLWANLQFGFVMLTPEGSDWNAKLYDSNGKVQLSCSLRKRTCS